MHMAIKILHIMLHTDERPDLLNYHNRKKPAGSQSRVLLALARTSSHALVQACPRMLTLAQSFIMLTTVLNQMLVTTR